MAIELNFVQFCSALLIYLLGSLLLLLGRGSGGSLILLFVSLQDKTLRVQGQVTCLNEFRIIGRVIARELGG